jgi:hypothetical protein
LSVKCFSFIGAVTTTLGFTRWANLVWLSMEVGSTVTKFSTYSFQITGVWQTKWNNSTSKFFSHLLLFLRVILRMVLCPVRSLFLLMPVVRYLFISLGLSTDDGQTKRNISTPSIRYICVRKTKCDHSDAKLLNEMFFDPWWMDQQEYFDALTSQTVSDRCLTL